MSPKLVVIVLIISSLVKGCNNRRCGEEAGFGWFGLIDKFGWFGLIDQGVGTFLLILQAWSLRDFQGSVGCGLERQGWFGLR